MSRQVEIDYYAFGRDERTPRAVDPSTVFSAAGQWYVSGWCHLVDDERMFRVDRIRTATLLDTGFSPPATPRELAVYRPRPDDPRVTLELDRRPGGSPSSTRSRRWRRWTAGQVRVTLAASERAWLERLLLRLGPAATVVEGRGGGRQPPPGRIPGCYGAGSLEGG